MFVRIHWGYPSLPVILASGISREQDVNYMKESGLAGYINKPYSGGGEMARMMRRIFRGNQGEI